MKNKLLLRFLAVGLLAAAVLSLLSLLFMNQISEMGAVEHRRNFMMSLASSIEAHPLDSQSLSFFRGVTPPGEGPRPSHPPGRPDLWVVNSDGKVLSSTNQPELPLPWAEIPKPTSVHEFARKEDWLKVTPGVFVVKMADSNGSYLVLQEQRRHLAGPFFFTQVVLLFGTVCIAVFLALSLTFYYLQRKSKEAKAVLYRLETGDLKARFELKAFDEFANLLVDFNRMADQIERLVGRVQHTERTRANLLQELGHDLRTPLTGLRTSFETLKFHWPKISEPQREELFEIMGGEIEYLGELLDKLMTISNLEEPHYRADFGALDLQELISQEVRARASTVATTHSIRWNFEAHLQEGPGQFFGDPHMVLRMVRNGLDNASKYANCSVHVDLNETADQVVIRIRDDGPGFSESSLQTFGHRLEHRVRKAPGDSHYSLGLGSVIMSSVAALHGGQIRVSNSDNTHRTGAVVEISLSKMPRAPVTGTSPSAEGLRKYVF